MFNTLTSADKRIFAAAKWDGDSWLDRNALCFKESGWAFNATRAKRGSAQPVANAVVFVFIFQGSSASWSFVNSSSTCRRWWPWGTVPASRWSSLPQSECLDCPSCPVGGGWKQWWENPALPVVPPIHFHTFGARWREGGAINHFSLCETKKRWLLMGWDTAAF